MKKQQIIENFKELLELTDKRIEAYGKTQKPDWFTHEQWKTSVINSIEIAFGPNHRNVSEFQNIQFSTGQDASDPTNLTYLLGCLVAAQKLRAMLFTLERWLPDEEKQLPAVPLQPIVFVAHGGKNSNNHLIKLKDFLVALGAVPIIVEEQPTVPSAPSQLEKVKHYMSLCNCGIALITGEDEIVGTSEVRGRPNIDNEIGMMSKSGNINGKIILLKQNNVSIPSNYDELIWAPFTRKSMDTAFVEIIRNLRGFGFF